MTNDMPAGESTPQVQPDPGRGTRNLNTGRTAEAEQAGPEQEGSRGSTSLPTSEADDLRDETGSDPVEKPDSPSGGAADSTGGASAAVVPPEGASGAAAAPAVNGTGGGSSPASGTQVSAGGASLGGDAGGAAGGMAAGGVSGAAASGVGDQAGKAVAGDGSSNTRRYAGAAASGAVDGAMAGGLHGAAVGAAKGVAMEAGKDGVKAAVAVTGGSPVASSAADRKLGAGGTSYERGDDRGSGMAKGVAVGGAAAATPPTMFVMGLIAAYNWLKSMFFMALALMANLGQMIWALVKAVVVAVAKTAMAPFLVLGSLVTKAAGAVLGVSVPAALAPMVAVGSGLVSFLTAGAVLVGVVGGVGAETTVREGGLKTPVSDCFAPGNGSGIVPVGLISANTEANAKIVYSVLKTWGMPNENIAGILGNWSQESGIDPTSVEGIFTEPYQIGPRKQAAWDGNFTHTPGQSHGGIGLGQWSNDRTVMLLNYAQSKGRNWYELPTQLAFMASGDNPGDVQVFLGMIRQSPGTPGAAALWFHAHWERSADGAQGLAQRQAAAEMWFARMSGWQADSTVVGGIEDIIGGVVGGAQDTLPALYSSNCTGGIGSVSLASGGMNQQQAQALIDLYNQEGDRFLDGRYGNNGGPGSCGDNHAMNCVSFSTYWVNKYTTFQQYAPGSGIATAHAIARMSGKHVSDTPTVYSVGSGPGSGPAGHTLVVLGIQGDQLIIGEAGYCADMGRVRVASAAQMRAAGWVFVPMGDALLPDGQVKTA